MLISLATVYSVAGFLHTSASLDQPLCQSVRLKYTSSQCCNSNASMQDLATTLTTQAQLLRMPRATSQALMPTGSLAVSRAVTLAVTPAMAVTLDVIPATAGATKVITKLLSCTVL